MPTGDHSLPSGLLAELSEFVAERLGLHFPRERWRDLERGARSTARELGLNDLQPSIPALCPSLLTTKGVEALATHLTVGETYFFRENGCFEALRKRILPDLLRVRQGTARTLRIWSAGCSSGEEPYSIAIVLRELIRELQSWQVTILATDINPVSLERAAAGVYGEWSFRGIPEEVKKKYFRKKKAGQYEILPAIKRMVTLSYLNLAGDDYPSLLNGTNAFDVILCRNVLMYFTADRARRVVLNLHRALSEGGWLAVSPCETSSTLFADFTPARFDDATFYRKEASKAEAAAAADLEERPQCPLGPIFFPSPVEPPLPDVEPAPAAEPETSGPERPSYERSQSLYAQGRYLEAAQTLSAQLAWDSTDSKAMSLLARIHANLGNLPEAAQWCEKALAVDKLNPFIHILHAAILQEQGAASEAIRALRRALYLDQNLVLAHFALGNVARQQGKTVESKRHFRNALNLLRAYQRGDILPDSDGMIAGRLEETIRGMTDFAPGG